MRYTSSVRLRFIRRTNDETNYCRTVDKLVRCDNCSSFKTGVSCPCHACLKNLKCVVLSVFCMVFGKVIILSKLPSKPRKWHFRESKFQNFPGGMPRTTLEISCLRHSEPITKLSGSTPDKILFF